MKRQLKPLLAAGLMSLISSVWAQAPTLTPGMQAPKLVVGGWLKGTAPAAKKGRFRIVEFWATWCQPCINAMPHLSALARKHADRLDVIGISVLEQQSTKVEDLERFVDEQKEMNYLVAYDDKEGTAAAAWLLPSEQTGIPVAFLMDDGNRILWSGHPLELDGPLELALAGKIDVEANRKTFIEAAQARAEIDNNFAAVSKAAKQYLAGDKEAAEKAWSVVAAKSKRLTAFVNESKLSTYPFGSPESDALVSSFLAGTDDDQARLAMAAGERAKKDPAAARRIVDRVVQEAKDFLALYQAALAYKALGMKEETSTTLDRALVKYGASPKQKAVVDFLSMVARARKD